MNKRGGDVSAGCNWYLRLGLDVGAIGHMNKEREGRYLSLSRREPRKSNFLVSKLLKKQAGFFFIGLWANAD